MDNKSVLLDGYGRRINYLRISVTDRCNLRCMYCMPQEGIPKRAHHDIMTLEELQEVAVALVELGIDKIRITGGEPLVRKGIVGLVRELSKCEGLNEITLTTNGLLLSEYARELKAAGLKRVNISLDTLNPQKFEYITRGGSLEKVLEGIKEAQSVGLTPIKLNTVLIGGFNDDEIEDFVALTVDNEIDVRFIELMPYRTGSRLWSLEKFISSDSVLKKVPSLEKIKSEDISSPAEYYRIPGALGKVGLINPIPANSAKTAIELRLTSDGKLKLCLHSDSEIDLAGPLRRGEDIRGIVLDEIKNKPREHSLEDGEYIKRDMFKIGG
nr:MoaA protein [Peptoclostridium acidaminophilum]